MVRLAGVLFLLLIGPVVSAQRAGATPIEVQKLRPNLFLVTGGSPNTGGSANTVVFVRSKDVVVIDTKGPRPWWGDAIADEVKRLTKLPITTIINTSASGDHVAGNIALANSKIDIIAHEHAAADMRKMTLMFTKPTGADSDANLQGSLDRWQPARTASSCITSAPDTVARTSSCDPRLARPADRRRVRWQIPAGTRSPERWRRRGVPQHPDQGAAVDARHRHDHHGS